MLWAALLVEHGVPRLRHGHPVPLSTATVRSSFLTQSPSHGRRRHGRLACQGADCVAREPDVQDEAPNTFVAQADTEHGCDSDDNRRVTSAPLVE